MSIETQHKIFMKNQENGYLRQKLCPHLEQIIRTYSLVKHPSAEHKYDWIALEFAVFLSSAKLHTVP